MYKLDLNWVPALNTQSSIVLDSKKYLASNGCDSFMQVVNGYLVYATVRPEFRNRVEDYNERR